MVHAQPNVVFDLVTQRDLSHCSKLQNKGAEVLGPLTEGLTALASTNYKTAEKVARCVEIMVFASPARFKTNNPKRLEIASAILK